MAAKAGRWSVVKRTVELLQYKLIDSRFFSFDTSQKRLFFPGCSLASADPALTAEVYGLLKKKLPELGLWFSCCGMPLKMFVSRKRSESQMADLTTYCRENGIREVITACGNCFLRFTKASRSLPGFKVSPLFDYFPAEALPERAGDRFVLHYPCAARKNTTLQESLIRLMNRAGIAAEKDSIKCDPLACCLTNSSNLAEKGPCYKDKKVLTSCANCVKNFQSDFNTRHILQVLLDSKKTWRRMSFSEKFRNLHKLKKRIMGG